MAKTTAQANAIEKREKDPRARAPLPGGRVQEIAELAAQCVQCGLCNAACPTYVLEGDERDGPRGRITLIRNMFAVGGPPSPEARSHIGRCLSCMACVTACPAHVDYAALIGEAKAYLHDATKPSIRDRVVRWVATSVSPYPKSLRWLIRAAPLAVRARRMLRWAGFGDLAAMARTMPRVSIRSAAFSGAGTAATTRDRRARVILLTGCTQQVLRPGINDATIRLLARNGIDVEVAAGGGCCGASASSVGDHERARTFARANIDAWMKSIDRTPADAIVFNSAGCGLAVKRYPQLFRDDSEYAIKAAKIAALAEDVTEYLGHQGLGPPRRWSSLKVAYHAPCQLHHGQRIVDEPARLIYEAGFTVVDLPQSGMCCGAGGLTAFREPQVAAQLRERKADLILSLRPDVVATGSIACLTHLEPATGTPIVHTIELLDWAHGGPVPRGLSALAGAVTDVPGPPPLAIEDYIRA